MKLRIKGSFVWVDTVGYTDVNQTHIIVRTEQGETIIYPENELTHMGVYESSLNKIKMLKIKATNFFYHYFSTNMLGIDWAKIKKLWKSFF